LISPNEIVDRLAAMVDVVNVPIVADADTGYGNALNAQQAARAFERAGVAAFHLEDQTFPKKCGHYDDKSLVPTAEMVQKLMAMRDALHDPDFIVIARTDAIAVEGFSAAIDRASAYMAAGADMIFVEAPTSEAEIAEIAKRLPGWKLINMFQGGKTPLLPVARLEQLGYHLVIIPSDTQRAALKAMQRVLAAIARDGSAAAMAADMATFTEREAVIGTADFIARDKRYASAFGPGRSECPWRYVGVAASSANLNFMPYNSHSAGMLESGARYSIAVRLTVTAHAPARRGEAEASDV
jgi:2-methylisocitrate lyase-like PEP mutase family enzyme